MHLTPLSVREEGTMRCSACNQNVAPSSPKRSYWTLIVAFWVFSLLFGIGAAMGSGWGTMLLIAWVLLASTVGVLVQQATLWSCPECGATMSGPVEAPV
jgi:predicted RNA-binding Zn-ribbon protein involved in translation (DUF1610 family)